jgi:hypothetical protein
MGRPRIHASNAERQRAYRKRNAKSQPQYPVTLLPWRVKAWAETIRWFFDACDGDDSSVAFLAKKFRVRNCVIRAALGATPSKPRVTKTEAEAAEIRQSLETLQALWKKFPGLAA